MKYFILFGPPGAGKGTQAAFIAGKYNLCHISTGELLRSEIEAGTAVGKQAKSLIDAGNLVPDSVVEDIIESRFNSVNDVNGFLLDGFPRTMGQARDLDAILAKRGESITGIISLMIPDEEVFRRIAERSAVEGRADDSDRSVIDNRIKTYHTQTEPLIAYYKAQGKYNEIQGYPGTIEDNRERVFELMEKIW